MYFHDCLYDLKFPEAILPSKTLGGEEVRKVEPNDIKKR